MSKVTNIVELYKTCKTDKDKQEFIEMQHAVMVAQITQINKLEEEIKHLQELLSSTTQLIPTAIPIIITPEEHLIEEQIKILEQRGRGKELTLEETKKFDLLIKNKRLIREQSTTIQGESKPVKGKLTTGELAKLALKEEDNV